MRLLPDRQAALAFPTGDIELAWCSECGFISNLAFQPELTRYCDDYEASQAFSPTFNAFHDDLARRLIRQFDLHRKTVLEIGCGEGDFLSLLCDLGDNTGIGFDPSYSPDRVRHPLSPRASIIADAYSPRYAHVRADFVCCKMTLEHLPRPAVFLRNVRAALPDAGGTPVYFQVPNMTPILEDGAFWDVYYEHSSYFTADCLARLFEGTGFSVVSLHTEYAEQYLCIAARTLPLMKTSPDPRPSPDLSALTAAFEQKTTAAVCAWDRRFSDLGSSRTAVLWGGGSKAVAFLSSLTTRDRIAAAVDINPFKQGKYLPSFGQKVIGPAELAAYKPDLVVLMNPIYREEVQGMLQSLGIAPALVAA
jgi:SAM-dependent methyltransferase